MTSSEMFWHQRLCSVVFVILQSVYCASELRRVGLNLRSVQMIRGRGNS